MWLRMPSLAGIFAIVGLAIGKVQATTMDCTSYYAGSISGSLTSIVDESDAHTLITHQCATPPHHRVSTPHEVICHLAVRIRRPNSCDRHVR